MLTATSNITAHDATVLHQAVFGSGVLSLFGSALIINAWSSMGRGRGFTSAIVMLALGDFVWACSSLALSALLLFASSSFSLSACQALRQLFQVGSWSSLAWSLCILVLVLDTDLTSDEARRPKLWFGVFGLLAYGVPALLMLLQLTIDNVWNVGADQHCYLQKPFHLYLWYLPVILAVGANILLFVAVLIRFRNSMRTFSVPLRMCLFPLVMGVTWGLNIITALLPVEEVPGWLVVLQSFLITGQGAWDCIIYSSTNGRFRHFYTKRVLRTVVLFVFGPLLVVPLLLRRALLYFSRRCLCCAPDALAPAAPHSSSASGSEGELLLRESFFPLSRSFSHPVPDVGIATSLPKSETGVRSSTPVQAKSMVDASAFVDSDEDE